MNDVQEPLVIRKATSADAGQIAEIVVEDWKNAYKGIIDDEYLDSMSVETRYQIELQRYPKYMVAVDEQEVLGFAWNEIADNEDSDCEIVALYVRHRKRNSGIGRALFQYSIDLFRALGKKKMIIWCLKENDAARKFYEKMGGEAYKTSTHKWGNREYDMISYLYHLDR